MPDPMIYTVSCDQCFNWHFETSSRKAANNEAISHADTYKHKTHIHASPASPEE